MATATADPAEQVSIPPDAKAGINRMSDKFKEALAKGTVKPIAQEPPKPAAVAEQPKVEAVKADAPVVPELKAPLLEVKQPIIDTKIEKPAKIPANDFKVLETSRDEFRTKAETAAARVKELEAKLTEVSAVGTELESIRKERDTYKGQVDLYEPLVKKVALAETPEFKRAFTDKITSLRDETKEAVGAEHAEKIAKLLKMPADESRDTQIEEIAEGLSGFKQANLIRAYTELRRTERERDAELSKASENIGKLEEVRTQRERQQQEQEQQNLESAFASEMSKVVAAIPEFQTLEGNSEHNSFVDDNRKLAKHLLQQKGSTERARIALWAAKGIASVKSDAMKDALIAKLQTQITEMSSAQPGLSGRGNSAATQTNKPIGFMERMKKAMTEGVPAPE